MLNHSRTLLLSLICASFAAFASDLGAADHDEKAVDERRQAIERQLSSYLDVDDIEGAGRFIERLAAEGELSDIERQAFEDLIWRTRAERMLDYSRKVREAIQASDLDAMRDYNKRMQRLTAEVRDDGAEAASVAVTSSDPLMSSSGTTGLPGEGSGDDADAEDVSKAIAALERQGAEAMAEYHLTRAYEGELSALDVVERMAALGGQGIAAAEKLAGEIMALYQALIERNIERRRFDKARTFAQRMALVAERTGLPFDQADALDARIERAEAER